MSRNSKKRTNSIWAKDKYDGVLEEEPEDFSDLAEEVMGKVNKGTSPEEA